MNTRAKRWGVALALAGAAAACRWAAGQEATNVAPGGIPSAPAEMPGPIAISSTHRFIASGMTAGENVSLAAAAEEVTGKIEGLLGLRLPVFRAQPLQLLARTAEATERGHIIKAQGWVDGRLSQKLIIANPAKADQEDVLEGLCWLLLNRYVIVRQTPAQRGERLGTVPDWLASGLAQNLYLVLRARNSRVVVRRWERGEALSAADILGLEYLPEGRWSEKAFAGVAFDWLASSPKPSAVFESLFSRLAAGEKITPDALADIMTGQNVNLGELEKGWDLWIAQQTQIRRYWGGFPEEKLGDLRALLTVRPEELGVTLEGVPEVLTLAGLIDRREEPWVSGLAARLGLKIRALGLGETAEFRAVVERYGAFLDALVREGRRPLLVRALRGRPSPGRLVELLQEADRGLGEFQKVLAERRRYVTEAELAAAGPSADTNALRDIERMIPRSDLRGYVDEAEKTLSP